MSETSAVASATPTETATPSTTQVATETPAAEGTQVTPPVETPAEKKDDKFASKFAALAKKEKEVRSKEGAIKEREAKAIAYEKALSDAKLNPLAVLESLGVTYDDITQFILNDNKPTVDLKNKALEDKIAALEKAKEEEKQAEAKAQEEYVINNYKTGLKNVINSKEEYELCSLDADRATDLAFHITKQYFEKTQTYMPVEKVLSLVEAQLEKEHDDYYNSKLNKSKKLKTKYLAAPAAAPEQVVVPKDGKKVDKPSSVTLTNKTDSNASTPTELSKMTLEQRKELAVKMLRSQRDSK